MSPADPRLLPVEFWLSPARPPAEFWLWSAGLWLSPVEFWLSPARPPAQFWLWSAGLWLSPAELWLSPAEPWPGCGESGRWDGLAFVTGSGGRGGADGPGYDLWLPAAPGRRPPVGRRGRSPHPLWRRAPDR